MNLAIITPCSRPENLKYIAYTIPYGTIWIICYDLNYVKGILTCFPSRQLAIPGGVWGYRQRNFALEYLRLVKFKGWVYFLDDDNILHPDFYETLKQIIKVHPETKGFVFNQDINGTDIRQAAPENVKVGLIDQAQYLLHTDLIGRKRFRERNAEDGWFIESLYKKHPDKFIFIDEVLCHYNFLRR